MSFLLKYQQSIKKQAQPVPAFSSYSLSSQRNVIDEFDIGNDWHGRPSVVERGGVWIMGFIEGEQHTTDGTQSVHIAFSTTKGQSWSAKDTYITGDPVTGFIRQGNGSTSTCSVEIQLINCPNGDVIALTHDRNDAGDWIDWYQNRSSDGGKTWSGWVSIGSQFEGASSDIWACYDHKIVGSDIYIGISLRNVDLLTSAKSMLYKSTDNGLNWTKVGDISSFSDVTWESSIIYLGDNVWLSLCRSSATNSNGAKRFRSTNNGVTWTQDGTITPGAGIHQPLLKKFANEDRLYLSGRAFNSPNMRVGMWYSDDNFATLTQFIPDMTEQTDGGYGDLIKRDSDTFILYGYGGTLGGGGDLKEYVIQGNE